MDDANDLVDKKKVLSHIIRLNYIVEGYAGAGANWSIEGCRVILDDSGEDITDKTPSDLVSYVSSNFKVLRRMQWSVLLDSLLTGLYPQ